jgi:hypothetical protein
MSPECLFDAHDLYLIGLIHAQVWGPSGESSEYGLEASIKGLRQVPLVTD